MAEQLLTFHPVTPDRWDDFVTVFGQNGACAGCWCMYWRNTRKTWADFDKERNKTGIKAMIDAGREPGLLAYVDGVPAAWVSIGPRGDFPMLANSRILAPVDDRPVWSIVCFFVHRKFRRAGLMRPLIDAAVDYARSKGAQIVEAYPRDPGMKVAASSIYTGVISAFLETGFVEVAKRSTLQPVMRKHLS